MLTEDRRLYVAHGQNGPICINGKMANRHGLIAGATGTGKTVTLQVLAETFSEAGVPCFMADMKGDLSGISQTGAMSGFIEKRCAEFGIENPQFHGSPVCFYDVFGEQGHPMRTTISNMGPDLMSRLMELNEVQAGVMTILFKVADERGLLLLDLKDLRSMLTYIADNATKLTKTYGNVSTASVGAIQRALLALENQGADKFFGEPAFDIMDLLQVSADGKGMMNVLAADKLMHQPKLYSTFLLWLLSDLYALIENEFKNYDEKKKNLYDEKTLQNICLGLHSLCMGAESKFFNGYTNITDGMFVTFGVKGLLQASKNIRNALLFNVLSYMSNELLTRGNTVASLDEFYLFLSNLTAVEYIRNFMKRVRKKESSVILASQNLEDFCQEHIKELTKPLFSIPTHQFIFYAGSVDAKFYTDTLQLENSEYSLVRCPQRGVCLYKCGNERYCLCVTAPQYKAALFGSAGGR